jgi:hypothetical protein
MMVPMIEQYNLFPIVYWLAMFFIAMCVLVKVTGYFAGDTPGTLRRAALTTLLMFAAIYLTYDVSGYLLVLLMQDPSAGILLPPQYTYWDWLREPFALKWHVLGFIPILRFVPVVLALCVGCVIQVVLWEIPFNIALVVFLAQVFLDLVAMLVLSFIFRLCIGIYEWAAGPSVVQQAMGGYAEPAGPGERPATLEHLRHRVEKLGPEEGPFWRRVSTGWETVNGHLQPLYDLLQPVTKHLPVPAQDFLNAGGWPAVLLGGALLALYWPRIHRGRKHHVHHHKKHHPANGSQPRDELALIGDAMTTVGARQVTVNGMPARLRLVVVAPASRKTSAIPTQAHANLLELILPGLGEIAKFDFPRVETWPDHHARERFRASLEKRVKFPERIGEPSRWLIVAGEASLSQGPVHWGLGLYTNEATAYRIIEVPSGQSASTLGIRDVSETSEALGIPDASSP